MIEEVHVCIVCGWVYEGSELDDGTHWHDLDDNFECPECGVGKSEFEAVQKLGVVFNGSTLISKIKRCGSSPYTWAMKNLVLIFPIRGAIILFLWQL